MKQILIICISICLILLLIIISTPNSEYFYYSSFKEKCNELYGQNNWSEYSLQYITIKYGSDLPLYTKDNFNTITCFKTGTMP